MKYTYSSGKTTDLIGTFRFPIVPHFARFETVRVCTELAFENNRSTCKFVFKFHFEVVLDLRYSGDATRQRVELLVISKFNTVN